MLLTEVKPEIHNAEMIRDWIRGELKNNSDWVHDDDVFVEPGIGNTELDVSVKPVGKNFEVTISKVVKQMIKVPRNQSRDLAIDLDLKFTLPHEFLIDLVQYEIGDQSDEDYDKIIESFISWLQVNRSIKVLSTYGHYLDSPEDFS